MGKKKESAAEKEFKKNKKKAGKKKRGKGDGLGIAGTLLLIAIILVGIIFLPTSMLLFVGMFPSLIAALNSGRKGARASTVTAMNLAGCIPFVFKLWSGENNFEASVHIITNPNSLAVIYMAAAFGYMIDWVVTGFVSSFLYQKGVTRMEAIKKRQKVLVEQWGDDVSGTIVNQPKK